MHTYNRIGVSQCTQCNPICNRCSTQPVFIEFGNSCIKVHNHLLESQNVQRPPRYSTVSIAAIALGHLLCLISMLVTLTHTHTLSLSLHTVIELMAITCNRWNLRHWPIGSTVSTATCNNHFSLAVVASSHTGMKINRNKNTMIK
jgi:hypothetical protein